MRYYIANIVIGFTLFYCMVACQQNELDIVYESKEYTVQDIPQNPDEPKPKPKQGTSPEGKWKGTLYCSACCDPTYGFDLDINNFDAETFSFNTRLTITVYYGNSQQVKGYAIYNCTGTFKNGVLKINGGEIIEKDQRTSCNFCLENYYTLKKVSANKFEGVWKKSSCDKTVIESARIIIEKEVN